jgi:hypothetical protein
MTILSSPNQASKQQLSQDVLPPARLKQPRKKVNDNCTLLPWQKAHYSLVSPRQPSSRALLVVQLLASVSKTILFFCPSCGSISIPFSLFPKKKKKNLQDSKYKTKFLWKLSFLVKVLTKPLRDFGVQIALS